MKKITPGQGPPESEGVNTEAGQIPSRVVMLTSRRGMARSFTDKKFPICCLKRSSKLETRPFSSRRRRVPGFRVADDARAAYPFAMKVFGQDGWDDPQMDEYNALDPRR
jgi:hypothetical protein